MTRLFRRLAVVLVILVGGVVIGAQNSGNTASADVNGVFAKVVSLCRPTRDTVHAVVVTDGAPQDQSFLIAFGTSAPRKYDNILTTGHFIVLTGANKYSFTTPKFILPTTLKPIPLPSSPILIVWSSYYAIGRMLNQGEFTNVSIGCPTTLTNTHAAPAVVSVDKVVKARLTGMLAPKSITERLINTSLLSIAGHGVLKNASGGTTPVTWQFSRVSTTKPWTGKLTVSLPVLGGRGIFAHDITVYRATTGQVSGRATRQVTLNGKKQTEVANWSVGSIVTAYS
jgi:hypothetical protein